jgi:hypothetical protein
MEAIRSYTIYTTQHSRRQRIAYSSQLLELPYRMNCNGSTYCYCTCARQWNSWCVRFACITSMYLSAAWIMVCFRHILPRTSRNVENCLQDMYVVFIAEILQIDISEFHTITLIKNLNTVVPRSIHTMKTVRKMKIYKSEVKFPLFYVQKSPN